ncbi:MAG: Wadjet anti-phage system protein JetD domain-containing protein, partial [Thiohalocapsa sp.]
WLDGDGSWPLQLLLGVPTERETARDLAAVRAWIEQWQQSQQPGELIWTQRQWPGLGRQRLPERLLLPDPAAVAGWAGEQSAWDMASQRAKHLRTDLEREDLSLGRHFDWLASTTETDFGRLLSVLRWFADHPASGLYLRQLPIPGVDTKWIATHRARVLDLLRQLQGRDGDLQALAGLRREPDLLRLRILDPALRPAVAGLSDLSAPIEEIAALPLQPEHILIVENLQTGLAMDDLPGSVCFMARGYAIEAFTEILWLRARPCHYWGDLDTHGFTILNRLRHHLPDVGSVLMNSDTLLAHATLWKQEDKQATGTLDRLTDTEQGVYQGLLSNQWGDRVRLEQERIDWQYAWRCIQSAVAV